MPDGPWPARHATPAAAGTLPHPIKTGGTGGRNASSSSNAKREKLGSIARIRGRESTTIGEAAHSRVRQQGRGWEGGEADPDCRPGGGWCVGHEGGALLRHQTGCIDVKKRYPAARAADFVVAAGNGRRAAPKIGCMESTKGNNAKWGRSGEKKAAWGAPR